MKFIHCADIHLGSAHTSLPSDKAVIRKDEILSTFERLCDYAKANSVSAVIIAGDLFDEHRVTKKILDRVVNSISKCEGVDFLCLFGNHDEVNPLTNREDLPCNFKIFTNEWTAFRYGNVVIYGVCFDGLNHKTVSASFNANKNDVNVVVMHGAVGNYISTEDAYRISLPSFKDKNVDYIALGHYHTFALERLDARGVYAYSGCLEGRGFDETGEKGFVMIDVDGSKVNTQFTPFANRKIYTVEYTLNSQEDWLYNRAEILSYLQKEIDSKSLIKLIIRGDRNLTAFADFNELTARLNELFFFAKIEDKTTVKIDPSSYENDKSIKGEFIRLVYASELSEQEKSMVLSCGLNALDGEDLL